MAIPKSRLDGNWAEAKQKLGSQECCVVAVTGINAHLNALQDYLSNSPSDVDLRARIRMTSSGHTYYDCHQLRNAVTRTDKIRKEQNIACLDFEKLEFPLLIRKWQQGDYFQPLGMIGFKKVSDFFIDEKIPLHQKENTWVLCSGNKIAWIMGFRIDNRFKIGNKTKKVMKIEIKNLNSPK